MLILVGVTINVALNGGLFEKAKNAADGTQKQVEKEELMSVAFGTVDTKGDLNVTKSSLENNLSNGWEISDDEDVITDRNNQVWYTCTSPKGNIYYLNKATGKIIETEPTQGQNDLEYLRGIFVGKTVDNNEQTGICADSNCNSLKSDIKALGIDDSYFNIADGNGVKVIVYNGVLYYLYPGTAGAQISLVDYVPNDEDDSGYFEISIEDENNRTLVITGLADDGEEDIEANHILTIPDKLMYEEEEYTVIGIDDEAFMINTDITGVIFNGTHIETIGVNAFAACTNLTGTITIPSSVTTIGDRAFFATNLTGILTIPSNVTTIGLGAFSGSGITGLNLNGTDLTTIGNYAFESCTNLTGTITIPSSVTTIGQYAFNVTGITQLDLSGNSNLTSSSENYPWGLDTSKIKFE